MQGLVEYIFFLYDTEGRSHQFSIRPVIVSDIKIN